MSIYAIVVVIDFFVVLYSFPIADISTLVSLCLLLKPFKADGHFSWVCLWFPPGKIEFFLFTVTQLPMFAQDGGLSQREFDAICRLSFLETFFELVVHVYN